MRIGRLLIGGLLGLGAALLLPSPLADGGTARAGAGKRVALVIGNSKYPVKPLPSPVKDAGQWKSSLVSAGFDVDQCLDCKLQEMKNKLATFKAGIAPGDEAFFYYGGHGAEENNINLLFPVDADVQGCENVFEESLSLGYVLGAMAQAEVKVVVLDACRSSPFPTCTMDADAHLFGPPQMMPSGTLVAYATRRGDTAADTGQGSAYSRAVLPLAFQQGKPLYEALTEATATVTQATGGKQEPWVLSNLSPASYALRPGISLAVAADTEWTKIAAMPEGAAKTSAVVSFLSRYGTSGASSVAEAQRYLTRLGENGTAKSPSPEKLVNPPRGGPTGRIFVARQGTAGEMSFIELSEGAFYMGSPDGAGESDERPQRWTRVAPFAIGQSEVTQAQWAAVVKTAQRKRDPDAISLNIKTFGFHGDTLAVGQVSWCDVARFANALSRLEGRRPAYAVGEDCEEGGEVAWDHNATGYRLPTEAEWEYAARAGTTTVYATGDSEADLARAGWYGGNSGNKTHAVCTATVKPWSLCDMHGNAWEWVWDWYGAYTNAEVGSPQGPLHGEYRVLRGGSWSNTPEYTRSAKRNWSLPSFAYWNFGFRLVRPVVPPEP